MEICNFPLLELPFNVLVEIFQNLNLQDLRNVMLSCKTLSEIIIKDNILWKEIFKHKLIIFSSDRSNTSCVSFYNKCRISHNWSKGIYREKVIIKHSTRYMPWLRSYNSKAVLLSFGSILQCSLLDRKGLLAAREPSWKVDVPKTQRFDKRTNDISRFLIRNDMIVCGNRDGCVSVYAFNNLKRAPKLLYYIKDCHDGGSAEVSAVEFVKNNNNAVVITASIDSSDLSLFDISSDKDENWNVQNITVNGRGKNIIRIPNNTGLRCLALNTTNNLLTVGMNGHNKPTLLDLNKLQVVIPVTEEINNRDTIKDIQWHCDNSIVYVTHSGKLHVMDARTGTVVYKVMDPFNAKLYCVKTDNENAVIAGASEYSRCSLFDLRNSKQHVQVYFTQEARSPVYSLDFDLTKLIAAADRSVATLNFNIGVNSSVVRDYSYSFNLIQR